MIVFAVYFITTDGRLMFSKVFQDIDELPSEFILSGLLTSFKAIANELTSTYPETLVMGQVSYHFENFEDYFLVLVTDTRQKPDDLAFSLGLKFTSKYGEIIQAWNGNLDQFFDFEELLVKEIKSHSNFDESQYLNPNERLDASALVFLPNHLKDLALILLTEEEITMKELIQKFKDSGKNYSFYEIQKLVSELQKMGYVGQKISEGSIIYFV